MVESRVFSIFNLLNPKSSAGVPSYFALRGSGVSVWWPPRDWVVLVAAEGETSMLDYVATNSPALKSPVHKHSYGKSPV